MRGHAIPQRQHGMAIVTAMLMTTLAVSAVAGMFWRQQVQVRAMENQRLHVQTQWVLRAGLDWARMVLRLDGERYPEITTLDGGWNAPMDEIRLDAYLERAPADGARSAASIAGHIADAQARYNLANLATARELNLAEIRVFERLLVNLELDPSLALRTALAIAAGQQGAPAATRRAALNGIDDLLGVSGYTPQVLAKLDDFIVLLPQATDVNVDTAAPEVLAAVTGLSLPEARMLATRRRQGYFRTMDEFGAALHGKRPMDGVRVGLKSDYFLVRSQVRLDRAALDTVSLIYRQRGASPATELVWTHED